jgi:hypothetical protein
VDKKYPNWIKIGHRWIKTGQKWIKIGQKLDKNWTIDREVGKNWTLRRQKVMSRKAQLSKKSMKIAT